MHCIALILFLLPLLSYAEVMEYEPCDNGNLHRPCRTDAACGAGNFCHETATCCVGPAPSGPRRVHSCPQYTRYVGPMTCKSKSDCMVGGCYGRWMSALTGSPLKGKVCCRLIYSRRRAAD